MVWSFFGEGGATVTGGVSATMLRKSKEKERYSERTWRSNRQRQTTIALETLSTSFCFVERHIERRFSE
jgi:hypothetical protein